MVGDRDAMKVYDTCPECGGSTTVDFSHTSLMLGGAIETPFLVCCTVCTWMLSSIAEGRLLPPEKPKT